MCDPVSAGMFAVSAVSQVAQHQQAVAGVKNRNRARLNQFDADNNTYLVETMLNNNVWKNDTIVAEYDEEAQFGAMIGQWQEYDEQLDKLFADSDFRLQESLIKMYKNEYAGEGTGVTAGRLAAQGIKEHGFRMAEETANLVLNQELVQLNKERTRNQTEANINSIFEKVRFPPVPGQTPIPPQLEAKPSTASLILGLAASAVSSYGFSKMTAPPNTGMQPIQTVSPIDTGMTGAQAANLSGGGFTYWDTSMPTTIGSGISYGPQASTSAAFSLPYQSAASTGTYWSTP